jgi:Glycosyl hydrolase family 26
MRKLAGAIALSVALAGCAGPLAWAPPSQTSTRLPSAAIGPAGSGSGSIGVPSSMLLGAYEAATPNSWSGMAQFATATGIQPKIALYYSVWNSGFNAGFAQTARQHGAYVFVQLQPDSVTLASVAAGDSDAYLRRYASAVRQFGHPVILSFAHEMNGNWYSWGAGHVSPATFVAAWRHVVDVFRDQGASNVTWVWTVNALNIGPKGALNPWWPGAQWVNWVGIDGYYYFSTDSFDSVFGQTIAQIRTFSQAPVMISETAVGLTADRETQIDALLAGARAEHVVGFVWFDKTQDNGVYHQNWRLEDDSAALAAFKEGLRGLPRAS